MINAEKVVMTINVENVIMILIALVGYK